MTTHQRAACLGPGRHPVEATQEKNAKGRNHQAVVGWADRGQPLSWVELWHFWGSKQPKLPQDWWFMQQEVGWMRIMEECQAVWIPNHHLSKKKHFSGGLPPRNQPGFINAGLTLHGLGKKSTQMFSKSRGVDLLYLWRRGSWKGREKPKFWGVFIQTHREFQASYIRTFWNQSIKARYLALWAAPATSKDATSAAIGGHFTSLADFLHIACMFLDLLKMMMWLMFENGKPTRTGDSILI